MTFLSTADGAAFKRYYEDEKNDLLKMSMDTLRLLKYILNSVEDDKTKGSLIGFVHAMRTVKEPQKNKSANPFRPYYRKHQYKSGDVQ